MSELSKTVEFLRSVANELDDIYRHATMPVQDVDIPGAFVKLRAVIGKDAYVTIKPEFGQFQSCDVIEVSWSIYDGSLKRSFEANTLADAVNECLAAHEPAKAGDAEKDMVEVRNALAEPLPL